MWIVGQNDPAWFAPLVADLPDVATCLVAVGEYAVGLYAPREKRTRDAVRDFLDNAVQTVAWHAHLPDDFAAASRLIGDAIYRSAAKPSFPDGLIAALALRLNRVVWTKDEKDFSAMGCRVYNPLKDTDNNPPA
jgi:predicted nucleic acid-binding protein